MGASSIDRQDLSKRGRALRWKYSKSSFALWFGSIWGAVGTVFFFAGLTLLLTAPRAADAGAPKLEGRVVEKGEDSDKDGKVRRWLRFAWVDANGSERMALVEPSERLLSHAGAGDMLELEAAPESGGVPRIVGEGADRPPPWLFLLIGLVFGGIGWGLVVSALRRAGRRSRIVALGKVAQGTVSNVELQTNVRINRRHPVVLAFEFQDDAGERRSGRSPYLPRDLEERWQPGEPIRVVYDPLDPQACEADIFDARTS